MPVTVDSSGNLTIQLNTSVPLVAINDASPDVVIGTGGLQGPSGNSVWGTIQGDPANQTDLINLINARDPLGSAASAIASHKNELNPHPQYIDIPGLNEAIDAITLAGLGGEVAGAAASAIEAHESLVNPHPQYMTQGEVESLLGGSSFAPAVHGHGISDISGLQTALNNREMLGSADAAIASHVALADPHLQYSSTSEVQALIADHESELNPHPQYIDIPGLNEAIDAITPASIGAEPAGTAAAAVTAHELQLNPHPQYIDASELNAAIASKIDNTDPRLGDSRSPSGPASGVLSGSYPNPTFAVDMATQAELNDAIASIPAAPVQSVFGRIGPVTAQSGDYNTDLVGEGSTNFYFTSTRFDARFDARTSIFGRSLANVADAAAGRVALALGSIATQNADAVAITGGSISGLGALAISSTTESTSPTNGGATFACGVGIAGRLNVKGFSVFSDDIQARNLFFTNSEQYGATSWPSVSFSFTSSQNDLDLGFAAFSKLSSSSAISITGILYSAPWSNAFRILQNIGSNNITLRHNSASSIDANRIALPDSNDFVLAPNRFVLLVYTSGAWRFLFSSAQTLGPTSATTDAIVRFSNSSGTRLKSISNATISDAGILAIANTTASNATTNGCAVFGGGVGISGALNLGGAISGTSANFTNQLNSGATGPNFAITSSVCNTGGTGIELTSIFGFAPPTYQRFGIAANSSSSLSFLSTSGSTGSGTSVLAVLSNTGTFTATQLSAGVGAFFSPSIALDLGPGTESGFYRPTSGSVGILASRAEAMRLTSTLVSISTPLSISSTTASTSTTTGSFLTAGGAGITGSLNVGGSAAIAGTLSIGNYTTATLPAAGTAGRLAYATDARWSGGIGCEVRDNGSIWLTPDGVQASTTGYQRSLTASRTLDRTDRLIWVSTAGITLTLPLISSAPFVPYRIRNLSAGSITIAISGTNTVEGGTTLTLGAGNAVDLENDGTASWRIM